MLASFVGDDFDDDEDGDDDDHNDDGDEYDDNDDDDDDDDSCKVHCSLLFTDSAHLKSMSATAPKLHTSTSALSSSSISSLSS